MSERRMDLKTICKRLKTKRPAVQIFKMLERGGIRPITWIEIKGESRQTPIYLAKEFSKIKNLEKRTQEKIEKCRLKYI